MSAPWPPPERPERRPERARQWGESVPASARRDLEAALDRCLAILAELEVAELAAERRRRRQWWGMFGLGLVVALVLL